MLSVFIIVSHRSTLLLVFLRGPYVEITKRTQSSCASPFALSRRRGSRSVPRRNEPTARASRSPILHPLLSVSSVLSVVEFFSFEQIRGQHQNYETNPPHLRLPPPPFANTPATPYNAPFAIARAFRADGSDSICPTSLHNGASA